MVVLKKRFPIIVSGAKPRSYTLHVHVDIILACCALHNYLMGVDIDVAITDQVDHELNMQVTIIA